MDMKLIMKDVIFEEISIQEKIRQFAPDIQEIFYKAFDSRLEALPVMSDSGIETEYIVDMLLDLKSRDQKLLLMRMGIVTGKPITMEEVAEILGITKARVKQIENKFLRKVAAFIKRRKQMVDSPSEE